eukprot:3295941-Pleurochrysis_carterae.AAC.1
MSNVTLVRPVLASHAGLLRTMPTRYAPYAHAPPSRTFDPILLVADKFEIRQGMAELICVDDLLVMRSEEETKMLTSSTMSADHAFVSRIRLAGEHACTRAFRY